jgi:hypothetical protein
MEYYRSYEYNKFFIKRYYEKNRDTILEKAKEKYMCDCGSYIRISDKAKHEKTRKHQLFEITPLNICTELSLTGSHPCKIGL